ncbi:V21 virophage-like protein [Fadolivirus algeromassiliense]|jgi:hypothetical protein|uniref:V21 virophage-like protein n=1 Tax=Fadolivirus FV1/VV64 TaxID=3070911 RepID=A0A7D3V789_9VIRU|nr:V21 virophage-like protein [Fadolivirus algeromassiliense]QKF93496.1 V21 virophage-like protein [Fadolivirus FV1/VV64]
MNTEEFNENVRELLKRYKTIKDENLKLKQKYGETTLKNIELADDMNELENTLKFGKTDIVDKMLGMQIDPKILIPLQANDLSQDLLDILNLISISDMNKKESNTHIVGSYRWRAHKYPGDIDMMEVYKVTANNEKDALLNIKNALQGVANDINKNPNVRLADCKCGFDTRFDGLVSNLGTLQRNYVLPDMIAFFEKEIPGYNRNICINEINNLERVGAINNETKNKLLSLLPQGKMTGNSYFEIYAILRKHRLLRWLISDLLNGIKFKPSYNNSPPYAIKLEEALKHNTATKMDLWAKVGTRWTELTNFFVFKFGPAGSAQDQSIGFKFDISIDDAVKYDIMYYSSPSHEKNTKLAKRIWARSISHLSKCINNGTINYDCLDPTQVHIIKKLYPVFSSDINKISQLIGDIELFNAALDKKGDLNLSYSFIFRDLLVSIETIPQELFRVLHLGKDVNEMTLISANIKQEVNKLLDIVKKESKRTDFRTLTDSEWDALMTAGNIESMKQSLETIEKIMKKKQDEYIKTYLIANKLHPNTDQSIVKLEYTFNYLNLPKVTSF